MLAAAKAAVREIEPAEAEQEIAAGNAVVLDVREPDEYEQGALPGAVHIPRGTLETSVEGRIPDKSSHVVVYCAGGTRSAFAAQTMQELGYTDVASVIGGFNRWKDEGREWSAPASLTPEQRNRYQRHLLLPEVGEVGQLKLLDSKVLLLGAGGLGSPAALYLAAAGVGTLGIIDMDVVDASNLQRQILHNTDRIGERKVDSAKKTLTLLNPDVNVVTYDVRLGADNILDIIDGYDVIVDGTDNFPTRYLVNDASLLKRIPVVHGSIFRFEGQATRVQPVRGALLPVHDPRASPGRAGPELCRGRRPRRAARYRRVPSRPSRPSSSCSGSARRCRAGCWPMTPSSRASAPSRCTAIPSARPAVPTPLPSSSPSTTTCACPTQWRPRPPADTLPPGMCRELTPPGRCRRGSPRPPRPPCPR